MADFETALMTLKKDTYDKIVEKVDNVDNQHFLFFWQSFSTLSKKYCSQGLCILHVGRGREKMQSKFAFTMAK